METYQLKIKTENKTKHAPSLLPRAKPSKLEIDANPYGRLDILHKS